MDHIASPPTPVHVILSLIRTGTTSDPTTVCLPTGMQARVSSGSLTASDGLFWEKELISVLTLYWCLVTVVKYGPVCSLPLKHNHLLSHYHAQTHICTYLVNCKVETRGREAAEASCGCVFSTPSLFYISAVLVTRITIIKWLLDMKHADHFGEKNTRW